MTPDSRHSPEYTDVQHPAIELLRDRLGYRFAHGREVKGKQSCPRIVDVHLKEKRRHEWPALSRGQSPRRGYV